MPFKDGKYLEIELMLQGVDMWLDAECNYKHAVEMHKVEIDLNNHKRGKKKSE